MAAEAGAGKEAATGGESTRCDETAAAGAGAEAAGERDARRRSSEADEDAVSVDGVESLAALPFLRPFFVMVNEGRVVEVAKQQ